jgi:aspartyl/glutamyl-tRNA(Asn/Gln) amidotransferase C subunit
MTTTDAETVRALARLARLALTPGELAQLAPELARILAAFEVLAEREPATAEAAPAGARASAARGDEPLPGLTREALLAGAPRSLDGFFVVPRTVGGEP